MSLQFGRFHFERRASSATREVDRAREMFARCSPDPEGSYSDPHVEIIYRAFHTTGESRKEKQPYVSGSGAVVTWDGRLDNRNDLLAEMGEIPSTSATDVEIVAASYDQWGTDCFRKLTGDWAVSIWVPRVRTILLATDFMGTRHLYYSIIDDQITWSTVLDPLILPTDKVFELEEEYVAGWLSFFPDSHLTPYRGVLRVPPCSFIRVSKQGSTCLKYWDFDPGRRIRYGTDREYEEHFRHAFKLAVKRRLHSDSPVLAELSGGVDSSSIVCVADDILASEAGPRLDTVSYYDDSEPNWDERPFFTRIEERRGRTGCHINIHEAVPQPDPDVTEYALSPGQPARKCDASLQLAACFEHFGNRVMLSGIGGDEVLGGVPNPIPELADLVASGHVRELAHRVTLWALSLRKPCLHLLRDTLRGFLSSPVQPSNSTSQTKYLRWVTREFVARNHRALTGYTRRVKILGPAPSFQTNLTTLDGLRRQLASLMLPVDPLHEVRYPYLDRDLLEFLYAIPRDQLVRPMQRRSLMRRALEGIVPDQVLNRRRKAYVIRGPILTISAELERITKENDLAISMFGVADRSKFLEEMRRAIHGADVAIVPLLRAFALESWLTALIGRKVFSNTRRSTNRIQPV